MKKYAASSLYYNVTPKHKEIEMMIDHLKKRR